MVASVSAWLLQIYCDPEASVTLQQQIVGQLRQAITNSTLQPGAPLPPSRKLAAELNVARNTVVLSYEQLVAEGYLETRIGSGVYVAKVLPEKLMPSARTTNPRIDALPPYIGRRGTAVAAISPQSRGGGLALATSAPDTKAFPFEAFARLAMETMRRPRSPLRNYSDEAGYLPLREAIVAYLGAFRGIRCTAENVIISSGTTQSCHLLCELLLDPGDSAWVEDPGHRVARAALLAAGAQLVSVPVDEHGLKVEEGIRMAPAARVAVVTPGHQYPLGPVLSLDRREALLDWAARNRSWVIEDDYDGEFRYGGEPISTLKSLDANDNVIYLGTFSKVMFPSLRLGYMIVPDALVDPAVRLLQGLAHGPTLLLQPAVAAFIDRGLFGSHVRSMVKIYRERQEYLLHACNRYLKGLLKVEPQHTGLHLTGWFEGALAGQNDIDVYRRLRGKGFGAMPISMYYSDPTAAPKGLLLGYGCMNESGIERSVELLARELAALASSAA